MTKPILQLFSFTMRPGEIQHIFAYSEAEARAIYATSPLGHLPITKVEVHKATRRQVRAYRLWKGAAA